MKKHENLTIWPPMVHVDCGGGATMAIVNAANQDTHLEWLQRYASEETVVKNRYIVAGILESYDYLLSDNMTQSEAIERLKKLRSARKTLLSL